VILYSIIPYEIVFGNQCSENTNSFLEIDYLGEKVQVSPLENNRYIIQRLISTSVKAFLDPRLQPGTIIRRTP